ncbi:MAG: 30S ribosomal protein S5 [Nanoarchaeota archaeon]
MAERKNQGRDQRNRNEPKLEDWKPKTSIGVKVKNKEITQVDQILDHGYVIMEASIVDSLLPTESELLLIGQSKGKFGGGQRRIFRQTQKKTREGNKPKFSTLAAVGDKNGHIGMGIGKSKETVPAREKAVRNAKLGLFKIARGCGSWECQCKEPHSIPFAVLGRCGSVRVKLMPAPKGKGLCCHPEVAKVLKLAGIQDVWSKTFGQTKNRVNLVSALEAALRKLTTTKVLSQYEKTLGITRGSKEVPHVPSI